MNKKEAWIYMKDHIEYGLCKMYFGIDTAHKGKDMSCWVKYCATCGCIVEIQEIKNKNGVE